jgi:hypothetical protein
MKHHRSGRRQLVVATMTVASAARAGVWTANPVLGLTADYASNPSLAYLPEQEETHGAVLLDSPTAYTADPYKLTIMPSFRISNAQGYSSLDSDYEHLTTKGEFDGDRTVLSASAGIARDSSLYHDALSTGFSNGSTGVRRDAVTADINWDRSLTELVDFDTDLNAMRVQYQGANVAGFFSDYKYASFAPTIGWRTTELNKWTFGLTGGIYDSLDGTTQSKSLNAQLGYSTKINELWSVAATAGYSRADNKLSEIQHGYELTASGLELVAIPLNQESSQNGTVFSFNLTRQGTLFSTTLALSRQLSPTGFAYLSRQEIYEITGSYQYSARWTLNGDLRWVQYDVPTLGSGVTSEVSTGYYAFSAAWQWTQHWTITIGATRVLERLASPFPGVSSNGVSLSLSRRFDPVHL